jgi:hypothetical protein
VATPFVQGRLRESALSVEIISSCAHCGDPIRLEVDSELNIQVIEGGPKPLVFEPEIDWSTFAEPNIINAY